MQPTEIPVQPPLAQPDDPLQANTIPNSMNNEDEAMQKALILLGRQMRSYLPLKRDPGEHTFAGVDLVDHSDEAKPSNALGHVIFAVQLIEVWEKSIESSLKTKIGMTNSVAFDSIAVDGFAP